MNEEKREIVVPRHGDKYGDRYYMTISGRIIVRKNELVRHKKGDEYGYAHVHLHKDGERELFKTKEVWKATFPDLDEKAYKGI